MFKDCNEMKNYKKGGYLAASLDFDRTTMGLRVTVSLCFALFAFVVSALPLQNAQRWVGHLSSFSLSLSV